MWALFFHKPTSEIILSHILCAYTRNEKKTKKIVKEQMKQGDITYNSYQFVFFVVE